MTETSTEPINLDNLVDKYVKIRDRVSEIEKRQKEELKPFKEALDKLDGVFLAHLETTHQERAGTKHGTVYKTTKHSATIADKDLFWDFVKAHGIERDLMDMRANAPAIRDYMKENKSPVPGVNFTSRTEVGILRSSK